MQIHPHPRTPETDEVLRAIGRNVLNFQYVEHLLKRLTVMSMPPVPLSKMAVRVQKHVSAVNGSTMGTLAGKLMDTVLNSQCEEESPREIDEAWIGFRFSIEVDAELKELHASEMQTLVEARNDLVHHFLPRWHSSVAGDAKGALQYLDTQMADTQRMMERLQDWLTTLESGRKEYVEFLASPAGSRLFELGFLQSSRLVAMLGEVAMRATRADGWAYLTTAAHLIRREAPDELVDLKTKFGLPNLHAVLVKAEFFDVLNEALSNGTTRTIYRIKENYQFTASSPTHIPSSPPHRQGA